MLHDQAFQLGFLGTKNLDVKKNLLNITSIDVISSMQFSEEIFPISDGHVKAKKLKIKTFYSLFN